MGADRRQRTAARPVATRAASVLRGKHRPDFTPHQDAGDFVIIINAGKVRLTGAKLEGKVYSRHTGYPAACARPPRRA